MGKNFKSITNGKVGDIIYPAYNGTNGFWRKPRWDLIIRVDKEGGIIHVGYIWDFTTVRAIQLMQKLAEEKRGGK